MEAAWACAVDRAAGMADSAKRFLLSFRHPLHQPPPHPGSNPVDILKRLQRQAFYDIMQLRERQEKVERVLSLFKTSKVGPFAEESTQVKGIISVVGSLSGDSSETESGISSRFVFHTTVRKKDSLFAELVTDHRHMSQENDHMESPLVLSKVMYLSNINDSLSVAAVPVGARCDDFSTDPNLRERNADRELSRVSGARAEDHLSGSRTLSKGSERKVWKSILKIARRTCSPSQLPVVKT